MLENLTCISLAIGGRPGYKTGIVDLPRGKRLLLPHTNMELSKRYHMLPEKSSPFRKHMKIFIYRRMENSTGVSAGMSSKSG